ncbi:MAG: hypothetical protein ACOC7U_08780 [Spirochaetota bacterium]
MEANELYLSKEDALWQKAVSIASMNNNWVPGKVICVEESFNWLGFQEDQLKTHSTLYRTGDGKVKCDISKIFQDGKDITNEFIGKYGDSMLLEKNEYRVEHPFRPSVQDQVTYTQRNKKKTIYGKRCMLYDFEYQNDIGVWKGTAWLEQNSGVPVLVEGTLQSVPVEKKYYTITNMEITASFAANGNGEWFPEQAVVDYNMKVGDKLFQTYRGRIKETYKFSNHWRYQ